MNMIEILDEIGVDYWLEGKNVTRGWVNIRCPFCDDHSNHLGINLDSHGFHCWRCGEKGGPARLLLHLGTPRSKITEYLKHLDSYFYEEEPRVQGVLQVPKTVPLDNPSRKYLIGRNYDPDFITQKYGIKSFDPFTKDWIKWKYRIFIPVFESGKVVTFTSRSIGNIDPKYKHQSIEHSSIHCKNTLYNLDNCVYDSVIITEGVMDVWRIGDGSIAIFGTNMTRRQIRLLSTRSFKRIFIMLDSSMEKEKESLQYILSPIAEETYIVDLNHGDPGELHPDDVRSLRKEIFR